MAENAYSQLEQLLKDIESDIMYLTDRLRDLDIQRMKNPVYDEIFHYTKGKIDGLHSEVDDIVAILNGYYE